MPGSRPRRSAHAGARCPASVSEVAKCPVILARTPASTGSTPVRKASSGRPPQAGFHIHLWPMAHTLRGTWAGSVMPHSVAATMSQCSSAVTNRLRLSGLCRSQWSSLEKPHSEE